MPPDHARLEDCTRLPVLVTRVARPDATTSDWFGVRCPSRSGTAPLSECARCDRCAGVSADENERGTYLWCRGQAPAPACADSAMAGHRADDADRVSVLDVMSQDTLCVASDLTLDALARGLLERGTSGAPVVDDAGRLLGMVSRSDLVREQHENGATVQAEAGAWIDQSDVLELGPGFHLERARQTTVFDIMTPIGFSIGESASIARAAALMAFEGVHRVPVTSPSGRVLGVVSALDIARWVAQSAGFCVR